MSDTLQIPKIFTEEEAAWLREALRLDFPNRDIVLEQLANCSISRIRDDDSLEILFEVNDGSPLLDTQCREIVYMVAYREEGAYIALQLLSWDEKIDDLYIYMPDMTHLELANPCFDDVEYQISDYLTEAKSRILSLLDRGRMLGDLPLTMASIRSIREAAIEALNTSVIPKMLGNDELSHSMHSVVVGSSTMRICIDLGSSEGDAFQGAVVISLLGSFFYTEVSMQRCSAGSDEKPDHSKREHPNGVINYPNGSRMGEARNVMYSSGYLPLAKSFLSEEVLSGAEMVAEVKSLTVGDCLFSENAVENLVELSVIRHQS